MYESKSDAVHVQLRENTLFLNFDGEAVDYAMLDTVTENINHASLDSNVRAVAMKITGDGDRADNMGEYPARFSHRLPAGSHGAGPLVEQDALRALHGFAKPTIAYMHNKVNGILIDLSSCCDVRIASASMTMTDTRILQGRSASTGITYILPRLIGQSQAVRVLLLGETLSAEECRRINFVHKVIADDQFEAFKTDFTKKIASMATRSWEVHKLQVIPQMDLDFESAMVHCLGIRQTHVIQDRLEGIKAWRERRPPEFAGK